MEEIKETCIEEMRIENHVLMTKVFVGGGDDFIVVSGNDISIAERFAVAGDEIEKLAKEMDEKISEFKGGTENIKESIKIRKTFSEKASEAMDSVFGEGSTRKFFADVYEVIPDFCPDVECFIDYFDSLLPVVDRISEHKKELEKLASRTRMEKYKPQDHRKPGGK